MPTDRDVFGLLVELRILCHRYRPFVISPDQCWDLLLKQAELAI